MYFLMKCMDVDEFSNMLESPTRIERTSSSLSSPQPGPSNGSGQRSIRQRYGIPLTTIF